MLDDILEFYKKFNLDIPKKPCLLSKELQDFRISFMQEELQEYINASNIKDMEGCFDALIDLVYVAIGTAVFHGFPFDKGWEEVHKCNMKKIRTKNPLDSKRNSSYDVVKPINWKVPNLKELLK